MLNTTINGTQPSSCYNPAAARIGTIFAYCLIFVVSLAGNISIGIIVYKTKTMRRPINFLIVNMAMSDLLYPIFLIPKKLTELYVDSWLISGPLGQALCKLIFFLPEVSVAVSIQSLVLIAVDRFGAVVFPLRPPVISSKLCRFLILATWIVAMAIFSPYLFAAKLAKDPGGLTCALQWNEVFGESSSYKNYILAMLVVLVYNPLVLIAMLYIIIYSKLKSQTIPGEQSANAGQQRVKRERNVLKMAIAIVIIQNIAEQGQSVTERGKAGQSDTVQSRAEQSRAEKSRAEQSRAEQSRAEQRRAEQSRAELCLSRAWF
ncbi:hypothetical protein ACROYT_G025201 [Oculina patagonica]